MMTRDELKASVAFLLRTIAERRLEGRRPDYVVGFDVTRDSRATLGWERQYDAIMAEREPKVSAEYEADQAEYEAAVRDYMRQEWDELKAHGMGRLQLACRSRHLPPDLRQWARRQLALAAKRPNALAVAYAVLVLRDAAEWESAHDAEATDDSALGQVQAEWVAKHTLEAGENDSPESLSGAGTGHVWTVGESRGAK